MRTAIVIGLGLALGPAGSSTPSWAKPAERTTTAPSNDFWREIIEPHSEQVRRLVDNARQQISYAEGIITGEVDPIRRMRAYRAAYTMMTRAHRLSRDSLDVLAMLGISADEIGKTHEAIEAFRGYLAITTEDKANAEITGRLGAIYLRLGEVDTALHYLRLAHAGAPSGATLVHLADAIARHGDTNGAIDVLVNALPPGAQYYTNDMTLVAFALAVAYDKNDRRHDAFEVLDRLKSQQVQSYAPQIQLVLAQMRFAPAEDRHYYQALLFESIESYPEARAEWATYAASGDLPARARALEHIVDLDKLRRTKPTTAPTPPPPPPSPHWIP